MLNMATSHLALTPGKWISRSVPRYLSSPGEYVWTIIIRMAQESEEYTVGDFSVFAKDRFWLYFGLAVGAFCLSLATLLTNLLYDS